MFSLITRVWTRVESVSIGSTAEKICLVFAPGSSGHAEELDLRGEVGHALAGDTPKAGNGPADALGAVALDGAAPHLIADGPLSHLRLHLD